MSDTTRKLIKVGTNIIETLNNYRRGICSFDDMYDLGFETYWEWKKEVFNHLLDNGIDEIKLDYLWEDDFLNRDYLKLSLDVENPKTKKTALDEITSDVKKLVDELIGLKPLTYRSKIIISNTKGIYRSDDEKKCYPIHGADRLRILSLLQNGPLDARTIRLGFNKNPNPTPSEIKNIGKAVDKINSLFKEQVYEDYDLIKKLGTKKYELNKENFEIIFVE